MEPTIDGVGIARFEQAVAGHVSGRAPVADLEQGRSAFPDVGFGVGIAGFEQLLVLFGG